MRNRLGTDAAKLFAAPVGKEVADNAMQVLGGWGYCTEYKVERFLRDAKLLEIGGGTLESHQKNITKELLARTGGRGTGGESHAKRELHGGHGGGTEVWGPWTSNPSGVLHGVRSQARRCSRGIAQGRDDRRGVARCEQVLPHLLLREQTRHVREQTQRSLVVRLRREQQEHELRRLPVRRIEIESVRGPSERERRFAQPLRLRVRESDPIAHSRAAVSSRASTPSANRRASEGRPI